MSARTTAAEASARVRAYLERHAKNRQGDPRAIHGYDIGEPSEAELLISDLTALIDRPLLSKGFIVGKKSPSGNFAHVVAVFDTRDLAVAWAENANAWYGEDHPLTPLTVWNDEVFINPKLFPAPNASVEEMFAGLAND